MCHSGVKDPCLFLLDGTGQPQSLYFFYYTSYVLVHVSENFSSVPIHNWNCWVVNPAQLFTGCYQIALQNGCIIQFIPQQQFTYIFSVSAIFVLELYDFDSSIIYQTIILWLLACVCVVMFTGIAGGVVRGLFPLLGMFPWGTGLLVI